MVVNQAIFEGKLLWAGHQLEDFTVRELCNMAFYHHVKDLQPPQEEGGDTIEQQIEKFEENIGQRVSSAAKAEKMFRESMIARGLNPDAKPELSPELAAKMEQDAMKSDKDIFFGDTDREFRGRKLEDKDYEIE